jgi:glutathionylspermidine synthase
MISTLSTSNPPFATAIAEGWRWINGEDTLPYVSDQLIKVSEKQAEAYYEAANELYEMFCTAAEHVVQNKRYADLNIPENMIPLIAYSWEHDKAWHIYGRFDLSGGLDGKPIKLIEFNADTATCIPETAIIQWAALKANNLDEACQFNTLFESLKAAFENLLVENPASHPSILFSTMEGLPEDISNVELLAQAAKEAGFETAIESIENVEFSETEGLFIKNKTGDFTQFDYWFKLIPWEFIAWDEPELLPILDNLIRLDKLIVLNPAYTLLFQSKGILKVLWELFPNHPLLLETSFQPLKDQTYVEKVMFGREGANVRIVITSGLEIDFTKGDYTGQKMVYQAYTEFMTDNLGKSYQAGVFISGEACGLGFRCGGLIIDNKGQFCGHVITES